MTIDNIIILSVLVIIFTYSLKINFSNTQNIILPKITPSILVSIGIFGTFLGIYICIQSLDINDYENTFPNIIKGMKVSFLSSIVGLFLSILYRIIQGVTEKDDKILAELTNDIKEIKNNTSQINLLNDNFERESTELRKNINEFEESIVLKSYDAFLNALNKVMIGFNNNLSTQLGDNFKIFNNAIGNVNLWQKQNKDIFDKIWTQFSNYFETIETLNKSFSIVIKESELIPIHLKEINQVTNNFKNQINVLNNSLEGFVRLREKAISAIPSINKNIDELTTNFLRKTEEMFTVLEKSLKEHETKHKKIIELYNDFGNKATTQQEKANKWLSEIISSWNKMDIDMNNTINPLLSSSKELSQKIQNSDIGEMNNIITQFMKETNNLISMSLENIEKQCDLKVQELKTISKNFIDNGNKTIIHHQNTFNKALKSFQKEYYKTLNDGQKERNIFFENIEKLSKDSIIKNKQLMQNDIGNIEKEFQEQIHRISQNSYEIILASFMTLLKETMKNIKQNQQTENK